MVTKRHDKVADSQQINFPSRRPQLPDLLKNEASICQEYEHFKGNLKIKRTGQFHRKNEILYKWFRKCCEANVYPDGQMLKEEALEIKKKI